MRQTPFFVTIKSTSQVLIIRGCLSVYRLNGRGSVLFQQKKGLIKLNKEKDYIGFLNDILERVEEKFAGKVKGEVCTSVKNNGVSVTGLLLKGEEEHVAPNFYLDHQFVEWIRGIRSMEEITERLCEAYRQEIKRNSQLVSSIQFSWPKFRRGVFMRLVNREKNKELLTKIPYREFLDLAVVYYYSVQISDGVTGTMLVTEEHLGVLGITADELHQAAAINCERFQPVKIRCMEDVVYDLGRKLGVEVQETKCCRPFLYVMTNSKGMFGALSMTLEKELDCFSERINNSFYLLPSSVHEVILVPAYKEFNVEYFADMVKEINETQVDATEVLSDSIYYYDRELKKIRRVA